MAGTIYNVLQAMDNLANAPVSLAARILQPAPTSRPSQSTADLTPPKVVKRKRRLTLPLDPPTAEVSGKARWFSRAGQQHTFDQRQSPLMRLPAELRAEIWGYVILGDTDAEIAVRWRSTGSGRGRAIAFKVLADGSQGERNMGVLGMLRSCRMIYSETIALLYSLPIFSFHNEKVETFLAFICAILQHRRDQIRYLNLSWTMYTALPSSLQLPPVFKLNGMWSYKRISNIKALSELPDATSASTENGYVYSHWVIDEALKSLKGLEKGGVKNGAASTGCFAQNSSDHRGAQDAQTSSNLST
ncbi:hypothetical protein C7974DRAFT_99500 [Boeremia exigua]|uniref:uncharacterized protein n=1 Tax=Boeremia exigua TaxID=749465 RepID=UPI001E8D7974|nr:uncharacterized protein C7974DRAFT_99500 [Boeremia exigua]KAH6642331.1 hypothetical protein C7974DRAFT_99500 [Boeremia exigua]